MGEGLFIGAEMTQRPLSPKPTPVGDRLPNLETWSSLHRLQAAQQVGEHPFQASWLVSASCRGLIDSSLFWAAQLV